MISRNDILENCPDWADGKEILVGLRGSDAHGTKIEGHPNSTDDTDVFVVVRHEPEFYFSLKHYRQNEQHYERAGSGVTLDILVNDIVKLFSLLEQANPNVLNWLWNRPEDYIYVSPVGQLLIDNRELFLSQIIFDRLIGYAKGQMSKAFDEKKKYQGYMGEKRKEIVNKYSYDVKNAAHVYRLIGMGIELLLDGTMHSYRPSAEREYIKKIKSGDITKEEFQKTVTALLLEFRIYETRYKNRFPVKPQTEKINELLIEVIKA